METRKMEYQTDLVNLSFKVAPDFRRRFKIAAATAEITQNQLLIQLFEGWEKIGLEEKSGVRREISL